MTNIARTAVLALDVGGTTMKAAIVHPDGSAVLARTGRTPAAVQDALDAVLRTLRELRDDALRQGIDAVAAGIVTPGIVDGSAGVVRYAANLGWRSVPLRELAEQDLGMPVAVDHDVRAAAVAESRLGVAQSTSEFILVSIGTGVGAALVHGDSPITGAEYAAGELGHITIDPDGPRCTCGKRGCLETYASGGGMALRYAEAGGTVGLTAEQINAARHADPLAARVWQQAIEALASGVAGATLLFDPELVVIGGGLSAAGDGLLGPLREELRSRWLRGWAVSLRVERSTLGATAARTGAALLALDVADISRGWLDRASSD